MAELVIPPTSATTEGSGSTNDPYIVATDVIGGTTSGSSVTAWIDGADTSFIKSDNERSSKGTYPKWNTYGDGTSIDASWVYAIGVRFRILVDIDVAFFITQLFGQVSKLLTDPSHAPRDAQTPPTAGTWVDYDYVFDDAEYDEAGWAPDRVQSALEQTFLYVRTWPVSDITGQFLGSGIIKVSEQRLVLYYTPPDVTPPTSADIPPLRLTNRDDHYTSARRLTGSRSRQGSNRLTGYL